MALRPSLTLIVSPSMPRWAPCSPPEPALAGIFLRLAADLTKPSALLLAARFGHDAALRTLVQYKALVSHSDEKGRTALLWASMGRHGALVPIVLAAGANPSEVDKQKRSPLMRGTSGIRNQAAQASPA